MRAMMLIAAATMLASCTQPATPPGASLAQETAGRIAGPPQSCIPTESPPHGLRVIDSETVAFGEGKTIYVSHFGAPCPGIEPTTTLIVEPGTAGQYCRGDHVRGREMGANISGPVCILGDWVPYKSS